MNIREGMRRLALVAGVLGASAGAVVAYIQLQAVLEQRQASKPDQFGGIPVAESTTKAPPPQGQYSPADLAGPQTHLPPGYTLVDPSQVSLFSPVKAPTFSAYLLPFAFPILGFLLPWTAFRALSWVLTGFSNPNRP